ncbi:MAG: isoleucine patch superfamily enzyme, carbonic anhydrase/acetyltransferase [Deltaproteobacteria bacterium]|nr:isoleucine patch superfamily enzyme, carbonic anhydrase/acetyltransferase [Deltaproteobacteria bacterium]
MLYEYNGRCPTVGRGTYVSETAQVIGDVLVGDNCYIGHGAIVRGDYGSIVIGSGTAVEEGVVVHAPPDKYCRIGKRVTIGHGAIIHAARVGDLAVIGMGSILSIYSEIGDGTIVAEGAVVKMRQIIEKGVVAGGNPARVIRSVAEKDIEYWKMGKQLYVDLALKYLEKGMKPIIAAKNPGKTVDDILIEDLPETREIDGIKRWVDEKGEFAQISYNEDIGHLAFFELRKGQMRGNHYHTRKEEVFYIISGMIEAVFAPVPVDKKRTVILKKGMKIHVPTGIAHSFYGIEDSLVVEYSPQYYDKTDAVKVNMGG